MVQLLHHRKVSKIPENVNIRSLLKFLSSVLFEDELSKKMRQMTENMIGIDMGNVSRGDVSSRNISTFKLHQNTTHDYILTRTTALSPKTFPGHIKNSSRRKENEYGRKPFIFVSICPKSRRS